MNIRNREFYLSAWTYPTKDFANIFKVSFTILPELIDINYRSVCFSLFHM